MFQNVFIFFNNLNHQQLGLVFRFFLFFGRFLCSLVGRRLLVAHHRILGRILVARWQLAHIQLGQKSRDPSWSRHGFQDIESQIVDGPLQVHCHHIPVQSSHVDAFSSGKRLMLVGVLFWPFICLGRQMGAHVATL